MARKGRFVYAFLLLSFCRICDGHNTADCNAADGVGSWIGDGSCDPQNLSPECDWDGGDCCSCTCEEDEEYVCGTDGFLCLDLNPVDDDESACEEESLPSCSAEDQHLVVENTSGAQALAEAINCSGGNFDVEWRGLIVVDTEIVVSYDTVLNVTGVGSSAGLDGAGKTRLFRVVNASLQLNDLGVRNGNATFGGAIAAMNSNLTLNETSFINNTAADKNGGAVFLYRSIVSFSGHTAFTNNSAKYGGALYAVINSSVSWEGVSNFTGNSASHSGGALGIVFDSAVSWDAETTFEENIATSYRGGALFLEGRSSASWSTATNFTANNALYEGGAILVDLESNVSWSGRTRFTNNSVAFAGGGAILIADSSRVEMSGETTFEFNSCESEGGAVSSRALDSSSFSFSDNQRSSLVINSTAIFAKNKCSFNGGAVALLGGLSASFESSNVTFVENEAGAIGGGVYISAPGMGPIFTRVNFDSNSAEVGGGVFITGSSTTVDSDQESANFDRCTFNKNKATATGGAIEIATGAVTVKDTLFKGNEAAVGGALRVAGAAFLERCVFEENISDLDGGQAIKMIGHTLEILNCSFSNNLYDCEVGYYLDESKLGKRYNAVCLGCDECPSCEVDEEDIKPTCSEAMENTKSSGGTNVTLQTLLIDPGYWRATNNSTDILACYNEDACQGGLTDSAEYCLKGYTGPYCSVCIDKYVKGTGFTCTKCSENIWGISTAVIVLFVSIVITIVAVKYVLSVEMGARQGIIARIVRRVPLQSVKIIIVAWQILTQFVTVADVTYPGVYQSFLHAVDFLNFDLTWMISAGCFIAVNFHSQLLILTIGPVMIMLFLGGTYTYVVRKHRASEDALTIARHKHVSIVLLVMFLVYSSTSSVVFRMFDCDELDDGKNYLRADYTIECDSPRHRAFMIYTGLMILLYPVGIPVFFAYLLFRNRGVLLNKSSREEALSVRSISDLWKPYRPSRFYYEVIECCRRIVLTGAILIVNDDSAAQIAVALAIAFIFTVVSEGLAPYESEMDAWVSRLGHAVVVSSMYYALLLKVDVSEESHESQTAFEIVLVAIHVAMILGVIGEAVLTTYSLNKGQVEDPLPRLHQYRAPRIHFTTRTMSGLSHASHESLSFKEIEHRAQRPAPLPKRERLQL